MKYLIALSIIQAFALLFFGVRVMEVDTRTNRLAALAEKSAPETEPSFQSNVRQPFNSEAAGNNLSLDDIRLVVREEITAMEEALLVSLQASTANGDAVRSERTVAALPPEETAIIRDETVRDINTYIAAGEISPADMADLQLKIARLPPADRREMLTRLTKAMNAGELQGEF